MITSNRESWDRKNMLKHWEETWIKAKKQNSGFCTKPDSVHLQTTINVRFCHNLKSLESRNIELIKNKQLMKHKKLGFLN